MVAQKGKDLLLKIDSDGVGTFVTVAGLRTKRIAFNSETVDITDADSAGRWREFLAGSGVQRAAINGSGIFKDAQSDATIGLHSSPATFRPGNCLFQASERYRAHFRSLRLNMRAVMTAR